MTINSANANNFNIDLAQGMGGAQKALDRIAAMHTVDNSSPADLINYNKQQSDILTASQGLENANQSNSILQIQDGGLQSLQAGAMELSELSVARNNAALNESQRSMIDAQANATLDSMRQTINDTSYNGQQLMGDISLDSIDISDPQTISGFMDSINSRLSDVGAAFNANNSEAQMLASRIENVAAAAQNQEYDIAQLMNDYQQSQNQIDAALFAKSHDADFLSRQVGALLG